MLYEITKMNSKKWMLISVFSFCVMTIGIKEISDNVNSFQIIFFRSLIGLLTILIFFLKVNYQDQHSSIIKEHLFRNIFHLIGQYGYIVGIIYLSLAEVTAIEFSVPIWILIIGFCLFKRRIDKIKNNKYHIRVYWCTDNN